MKRLLILALFAGGCALQQVWHHNTKTELEFYQDNSYCLAMASGGGNPQIVSGGSDPFSKGFIQGWNQATARAAAQRQQTIYTQCMLGKAYYLGSTMN